MDHYNRALMKTLVFVLVLASTTLAAHHSFAMYDRTVTYVFTGVVDRIIPDGAHMQIVFVPLNEERKALVRDDDGKTATWMVEMGGSAQSARDGITVESFARGTVFSVGLAPLRSGQRGGARMGGLFKCPAGKPPAADKHCDSVEGATSHGDGALAKATAKWGRGSFKEDSR
jgi:hypothetical protein